MLNKLEPKHGKHEGRGKTGSRLWKTESVTLPEPTQDTGDGFSASATVRVTAEN